jgi:glucose-1-phosphatase
MKKFLLLLFCMGSLLSTPPKVVVFDFGNVIADVNRKPMLEFLSSSLGLPYKKVKEDFHYDKLYLAIEKPIDYWERYAKKTLPQNFSEQLEVAKKQIVRKKPGMEEVIQLLQAQGIQVAILSNTTKYRSKFIAKMGGYAPFDPVLLSCDLGIKKPDPKIYDQLLKRLHCQAKECLFIDDKKCNVSAGVAKGINGILFESPGQLKDELVRQKVLVNR